MISASDKVTVCNKALAMIGVGAITAMTDATDHARFCNAIFEDLVYELLDEYDWSFVAVESTELARYTVLATEVTPNFKYAYAYTVPSNMVILELYQGDSPSTYPWVVRLSPNRSSMVLETDQSDDVYVRYAYMDGTTKAHYSYGFWKVIGLRLAAHLALALHQDMNQAAYFRSEADRSFDMATLKDAQNSDHETEERSTAGWETSGR